MSKQSRTWQGGFGISYTDRNARTLEEVTKSYISRYNITPLALKSEFVGDLDRNTKILEVGCNIGNQLTWLQAMRFKSLYGIDVQEYAAEIAETRNLNIIISNASRLPFGDDFFDLVFTDGMLIHISPENISQVLQEIHRCSNRYIWGFEYYADEYTELLYREQYDLMWKTDFVKLYLSLFPDLHLVKKKYVNYIKNDNVDMMFLLEKKT